MSLDEKVRPSDAPILQNIGPDEPKLCSRCLGTIEGDDLLSAYFISKDGFTYIYHSECLNQ